MRTGIALRERRPELPGFAPEPASRVALQSGIGAMMRPRIEVDGAPEPATVADYTVAHLEGQSGMFAARTRTS